MTQSPRNARLTDFIEFYILLSIDAHLAAIYSNDPTAEYNHTLTRFKYQLDYALNTLADELALSVLDYILIAGAGECRYAMRMTYNIAIAEISHKHNDRNRIYSEALQFNKIELADAMTQVFNDEWAGTAYGGRAWAVCTQTALDYLNHQYNNIAFLDRAADLEHNGGTLFNKTTAYFTLDYYGSFIRFLDQKFNSEDYAEDYLKQPRSARQPISRETAKILRIYNNLFLGRSDEYIPGNYDLYPGMFIHPRFGNVTPTIVDKNHLSPQEKRLVYRMEQCSNCGEWLETSKLYTTFDGYKCCEDCIYTCCDHCGMAIIDENDCHNYNGYNYCPHCRPNLTTCAHCGNHTRRDYKDWKDHYICYTCYLDSSQCYNCDGYIPDEDDVTTTEDGYTYCPNCKPQHTITCHACQEIYSDYNNYAILGNKFYCEECRRAELDICPICGKKDYNHRTVYPIYSDAVICDECAHKAEKAAQYQMTMELKTRQQWNAQDYPPDKEYPQWKEEELPQWLQDYA